MFNKTVLTVYGQRYLEALAKNPVLVDVEFIKAVCDFNRAAYDSYFRDQPLTPPESA